MKADAISREESEKIGRRQVVEWIENNFFKRVISEDEWEAQKKKWGLDPPEEMIKEIEEE